MTFDERGMIESNEVSLVVPSPEIDALNLMNECLLPVEHDTWRITAIEQMDPVDHEAWNKTMLAYADPLDPVLGDDAMPAYCVGCHGIFWGSDMVSIRQLYKKLMEKASRIHSQMTGQFYIIDEETYGKNMVEKIRKHRYCKRCYESWREIAAKSWLSQYSPIAKLETECPYPEYITSTSGPPNIIYSTTT